MKYFFIATTIALAGLFVGGGVGSYFTSTKLLKQFQNIPGSPIILNAVYDRERHLIAYSISNPGTVPLTIIEKAFVFTPGKESEEKGYILSGIPANITIPPLSVAVVELKLKEGTQKLRFGDLVVATFTYKHPLSEDIYTLVHPFKYEAKTIQKEEKPKEQEKKEEQKREGE
ncbi:MAG: hypothetical protein GXO04_02465 [Aquificae bacterium]|nr:hypothetical protein [Aquificota bacterium]